MCVSVCVLQIIERYKKIVTERELRVTGIQGYVETFKPKRGRQRFDYLHAIE
jgi:hypothetical protein